MKNAWTLTILVAAQSLAGCGSAGSGDADAPTAAAATVNILLDDEGTTDLLAFEAAATELWLVAADGSTTKNLLASERTLDLADLEADATWLASATLATGTWEAVELAFDPASLGAWDEDGAPLVVDAGSLRWSAPLATPFVPGAGTTSTLALTLDIAGSLEREDGTDVVAFEPTGEARDAQGESLTIAELTGTVEATDPTAATLRLAAHADADRNEPLGSHDVELAREALLVRADGTRHADAAELWDSLQGGTSTVALSAQLEPDGGLCADRVAVLDAPGSPGFDPLVVLAGVVVELDLDADRLTLLARRAAKGRLLAAPLFDRHEEPRLVTVGWSDDTVFLERRDTAEETDLAVGQRLRVSFGAFDAAMVEAAPETLFEADRIRIRGPWARFHGRVVDTAGLPERIVVAVNERDPLVVWGHVAHPLRLVTVELDEDTNLFLDVQGHPAIAPEQLAPGARVRVRGHIEGPPGDRVVDARRIRLRQGRMRLAVATGVDEAARLASTLFGVITRPFSFEHPRGLAPRLEAALRDETQFRRAATDEAAFYQAVGLALEEGRGVVLDVRGVEHPEPDTLDAYVVKTSIETPQQPAPSGDG